MPRSDRKVFSSSPILEEPEEEEEASSRTIMAKSLSYVSQGAGLQSMEDSAYGQLRAEEKLQYMLSTKCFLTSLKYVADYNPAADDIVENRVFRVTGSGDCSVVWSRSGITQILKVAKPGKVDQLYEGFLNHYRVRRAFERTYTEFKAEINVPRLGLWITPKNDKYWKEFLRYFPPKSRPMYGFLSERIFGLPYTLREALFDILGPDMIQTSRSEYLAQEDNNPCLIHLHIGRRQVRRSVVNMRDFILAVDQMEKLRLDTARFATIVGKSLAVMHWLAKIDAYGVEFILGASAYGMLPSLNEYVDTSAANAGLLAQAEDFGKRSLKVWIIDFDQCRTFNENNKTGLKQLKCAFAAKDAYYPKRPFSSEDPNDWELWNHFKEAYLTASSTFTSSEMPAAFMEAVENEF